MNTLYDHQRMITSLCDS